MKAATEARDPCERLTNLARLAAPELSYVETIQLDKALANTATMPAPESYARLRIAVVGSSTLDHLLPAIRVAGLRSRLLFEVRNGGYGQYRQEVLGDGSPLLAYEPDVLLISLARNELVGTIPVSASRETADRAIADAIADLRVIWRTARERFGSRVVQQSFLDTTHQLFGSHERLIPGAPGRIVARLNDELADAAASDGVLLLDVAAASARDGIDAWFEARHWLQGKMEIAPGAAGRYAALLARLIGAQHGRSKKCLVLDLDNTLWGGVIGDVGLDGIKLGEGSAVGEAHLALQKYAKQLNERGVVLAVCSKNEQTIVDEVFDRHPEMHLRRTDIAAFAVNWNDKAQNLRVLAERLNLGLDSFVFVDDNPAERARIRESLPMVAVPELPDDPANYVSFIARESYFEATVFTDDDRSRATQYAANIERETLRGASQSMDEFLGGLKMSVVCGPIAPVDVARAAQLINKTNQFNTTTRRISAEELERRAVARTEMALQFRLVDRFGDNGLVSIMLFSPSDPARSDVLELTSWVMSCRVFGRQLEHEAMNVAVEAALRRRVHTFVADYIPTAKNAVIKELFAKLGFQRDETSPAGEGASRWTLDLNEYQPLPTRIERKERGHD